MNTQMITTTRQLGDSGIEVSAIGLGCWAIGGHFLLDGRPDGYGAVDDAESIRAIHAAIDAGVTFFDTADAYGTGHSEEVLGRAVRDRRDTVTLPPSSATRSAPSGVRSTARTQRAATSGAP